MALDFAVTSGMRDIPSSIRDASSAATSYEDYKHTYLNTEAACSAEGFAFTPVVCEAVGGGWGPAANKIVSELAKEKSIITGEPAERLETQLHQGLNGILHRENRKGNPQAPAWPNAGRAQRIKCGRRAASPQRLDPTHLLTTSNHNQQRLHPILSFFSRSCP